MVSECVLQRRCWRTRKAEVRDSPLGGQGGRQCSVHSGRKSSLPVKRNHVIACYSPAPPSVCSRGVSGHQLSFVFSFSSSQSNNFFYIVCKRKISPTLTFFLCSSISPLYPKFLLPLTTKLFLQRFTWCSFLCFLFILSLLPHASLTSLPTLLRSEVQSLLCSFPLLLMAFPTPSQHAVESSTLCL